MHEAIAYGAVVGDEVVVHKSSNSWCVMCEHLVVCEDCQHIKLYVV